MLLVSNIIIYTTQPAYQALREFIANHLPSVSAVYQLTIVTHNTKDFIWIAGIKLFDPLTEL